MKGSPAVTATRRKSPAPPVYEISSDYRTVWVNSAEGCLGRFGVNGIDIHRPMSEQRTKGECLHCTHEPTTLQDWGIFVLKMKEFFNIRVPAKYLPIRFRKEKRNGARNGRRSPHGQEPVGA